MLLENRQRKTWNKSATYWARASKHASEEGEENVEAISVCFYSMKCASSVCYIWCLKQIQWEKNLCRITIFGNMTESGHEPCVELPINIRTCTAAHIHSQNKKCKKPWRHLEAFISPCKYRHNFENWKITFMFISADYPQTTVYYQ